MRRRTPPSHHQTSSFGSTEASRFFFLAIADIKGSFFFFFTHRQFSPVSWGTRVGAPIHQFPLGMFGCVDAGRNSLANRDEKDGKDEAGTEVEARSPTSSEKKPGI